MIDRVSVAQDDEGVWWLQFYANDIRHVYALPDILNAMIATQQSVQWNWLLPRQK